MVWKYYINLVVNKNAICATGTISKNSKEGVANTPSMSRHLSTIHSTVKSIHPESGNMAAKKAQS